MLCVLEMLYGFTGSSGTVMLCTRNFKWIYSIEWYSNGVY